MLTEAATSSTYYPWPTNKHGARNYVRDTGQVHRNILITVYVVPDILCEEVPDISSVSSSASDYILVHFV